jgi:DnaJ like chaperone protein
MEQTEMRIPWGKFAGTLSGFVCAGGGITGVVGAGLGCFLGHYFDRGMASNVNLDQEVATEGDGEGAIQSAFFSATFVALGRLAKTDGHISEEEIHCVRSVIERMSLTPDMRDKAIQFFNQGKSPQVDVDHVLKEFKRLSGHKNPLVQLFFEILLEGAYAEGALHPSVWILLQHMADTLHYPRRELHRLTNRYRSDDTAHPSEQPRNELLHAYQTLGVRPGAGDFEIKLAYRRLMNKHHPDKLIARGLPEEMLQLAKARTQDIHGAYEQIKSMRAVRKAG